MNFREFLASYNDPRVRYEFDAGLTNEWPQLNPRTSVQYTVGFEVIVPLPLPPPRWTTHWVTVPGTDLKSRLYRAFGVLLERPDLEKRGFVREEMPLAHPVDVPTQRLQLKSFGCRTSGYYPNSQEGFITSTTYLQAVYSPINDVLYVRK